MQSISQRWQEVDIQALIDERIEEGQHIDYKDSRALANDGWKKELCKDVSAMANADGGVIIYGVTEEEFIEGQKRKIRPQGFDTGIDPTERTKEQIVQVINDGIQRRPEFCIDKVELSTQPGRVAYVIRVPRSMTGAHQLVVNQDYRYYQRQETETRKMQDWQIRDVMNRQSGPNLSIQLSLSHDHWVKGITFPLGIGIQNRSKMPAEYALVTIWIDKRLLDNETEPRQLLSPYFNNITLDGLYPVEPIGEDKIWACRGEVIFKPVIPLFGSKSYGVLPSRNSVLPLTLPQNDEGVILGDYYFQWEIETPGMETKRAVEKISILSIKDGELEYKRQVLEETISHHE